jgi:hypothetical protein
MARQPAARPPRQRGRLLAVLTALPLVLGLLSTTAPPARSATASGYDISWPQCPVSAGGFGLPMPPTTSPFLVVGLTKGLPFTQNPCLADQVGWGKTHARPAQAYTMAAFPTAAQLSAYRSKGPWSASTRAGQLSNVGWSEAAYAVANLRRTGFAPPVVWIDVEPRPAQPWPTSTARQQRENRYVVEGLMRGLREAGFSYGIYSYLSGWKAITGSWWLPGVPVWATAGRLDSPTEAVDLCRSASFSGGPVRLSQWYDDTRDHDLLCAPYAFTPLPVPASTLSGSTADWSGDWKNDVLARGTVAADLRLYAGTGRGTLAGGVRIGTGWRGYDGLETPGDLTGDGNPDVLARERSTGSLWIYPGNGRGGWLPRVRAGTGWNIFNALVGAGDLTGDQRPDVLARERSTGSLWLYPGNGRGGWLPRVRAGTGWNIFNAIVGPGDLTGDDRADLLARQSSNGYLWLYPGNGRGGWLPRVRVGTGWNGMTAVASAGDLNGDRVPDILARDRSGILWLYPRSATGTWLPRVRLGAGWNTVNPLF